MKSKFHGKNYYEILGVPATASSIDVQRAFRKLALTLHPDKVAETEREQATADFQYVVNVMETLNDADKRAYYDLTGEDSLIAQQEGKQPNKTQSYYFQKFVTIVEILDAKEKYVGTQEEIADVCASYERHKGNMTNIIEDIMHSTDDDVDRFRTIIETSLKSGLIQKRYEITFGPSTSISVTEEDDESSSVHGGDCMNANEDGYFEPATRKSNGKRPLPRDLQLERVIERSKREANADRKQDQKGNAVQNERKDIPSSSRELISDGRNGITPLLSIREKNRQRHMDLCSSLEKRYRPKNHVDQEITEEEFQRISATLKARQQEYIQKQQQNERKRQRRR